jgi:3-isopropylmalate dehydrogenase
MLLRHSLGLDDEARCVEKAVAEAIDRGALTADLAPAGTAIGTEAMTAAVIAQLQTECEAVMMRD